MNKRFLIPALAWSLLALSFAGCTDDNMSGSDPLPEGTEFDFGTTLNPTGRVPIMIPRMKITRRLPPGRFSGTMSLLCMTTSTSTPPRR